MSLPVDIEELSAIGAKAQAYADWFQLPLKDRTWRGNSGDFAGSGVGSSLDFQDHRTYLPGDDPRHINWQAYARTGNYSMKLYREEVRPLIEIILDVSDSHFFDPEKTRRTLELFYFCHHATVGAAASTMLYLVKGDQQLTVTPEAIFTHQWATQAAEMNRTESSAPPNLNPLPFRGQSLRILISDLLFSQNPEILIRELTRSKGGAIIFCPYLQSEANPGWEGNYEFVDSESSGRHDHRVDRGLMKRYLTAYQRHFESWTKLSRKYGLPLARVPAEPEFETALQFEAIPAGAVQMG
ncbi:MAG: DUF58 domain-containing protein [Verrucomicrobiales bacterium]|nr:DUF58 domain-containing protein [Verrucomicrobiales bacterium]